MALNLKRLHCLLYSGFANGIQDKLGMDWRAVRRLDRLGPRNLVIRGLGTNLKGTIPRGPILLLDQTDIRARRDHRVSRYHYKSTHANLVILSARCTPHDHKITQILEDS